MFRRDKKIEITFFVTDKSSVFPKDFL